MVGRLSLATACITHAVDSAYRVRYALPTQHTKDPKVLGKNSLSNSLSENGYLARGGLHTRRVYFCSRGLHTGRWIAQSQNELQSVLTRLSAADRRTTSKPADYTLAK